MNDHSNIARWVAAAIMVTRDGRYLMQLRDDEPHVFLRSHWALFGGAVEIGEAAEAALRRELFEELEYQLRGLEFFTDLKIVLPFDTPRTDRMTFFIVPIEVAEIAKMVLREGAGHRLFRSQDLALEKFVAPWDLAAVLMHAHMRAANS